MAVLTGTLHETATFRWLNPSTSRSTKVELISEHRHVARAPGRGGHSHRGHGNLNLGMPDSRAVSTPRCPTTLQRHAMTGQAYDTIIIDGWLGGYVGVIRAGATAARRFS